MSKKNTEKQTKTSPKLPYRSPEIYFLGSVEQVQANYAGNSLDGPDGGYYYNS